MDKMYSVIDQVVCHRAMEDLRQHRGLEEDDVSEDDDILIMGGFEFLDELLHWNGIIGYTADIIEMVKMAYGIDLTDDPFIDPINRTAEEW